MAERFTNTLLIPVLLVLMVGLEAGILALEWPKDGRVPAMLLRVGHPPVQWQGWQLIPPAHGESCQRDDYDSCSDRHEDEEPAPPDDNDPIPA
jgi:hypothetical protein